MTRYTAPTALQPTRIIDPFVARDRALELRSQYLSHLAGLAVDALRQVRRREATGVPAVAARRDGS